MAQRLVAWNELGSRFMPDKHGEAVTMSLDYATLVHEQPKLAQALGRGRIVSHNVLYYGYGVLFTFVVED
ncbi:hypothetical protein OHT57_34080 [Streptomyces sp. NBC_00285]|uniref:hypothetical protein n=1 Tax=Streptomyces sp. NBC_00285 TaxID=2975700 RepID=UPI002E2C2855|nr:hypothetical protein [Streptomyces sp. NBC_00285]